MKSVVITGATGFIGQALAREFLAEGYKAVLITRNSDRLSSDIKEHKNSDVFECPLDKLERLWEALSDESISAFYHLAWGGNAGPERADLDIQLENVNDALAAFKFASSLNCAKFICAGTVSEFLLPFQTQHGLYSPNMKYVLAKDFTLKLLNIEALKTDMAFIWARLANTFGEGNNTGNILDYTIKTLIRGEKPQFSSASQPYDLMYVKDTVTALALLAKNKLTHREYYIGSGKPRLLREYLTAARDAIDPALPLGIGERSEDGLIYDINWFDTSALKEDTGFEASCDFSQSVAKTAAYLKGLK